jgi:hypothetical protein
MEYVESKSTGGGSAVPITSTTHPRVRPAAAARPLVIISTLTHFSTLAQPHLDPRGLPSLPSLVHRSFIGLVFDCPPSRLDDRVIYSQSPSVSLGVFGASEKFSDNSLDDISPGLDILEAAISYRYCGCCCGGAGFLN